MRSLKRLIEIVESTIDVSEWEHDGIDWQEVADACMNDDQRLTVDEFCIALEAMVDKRIIFGSYPNRWYYRPVHQPFRRLNEGDIFFCQDKEYIKTPEMKLRGTKCEFLTNCICVDYPEDMYTPPINIADFFTQDTIIRVR